MPEEQTPEVRYTKGPDELMLGKLPLVRADLEAADPKKPNVPARHGWRATSPDLAAEALRPGRVAEYGFEVRNYTPPPAAEDAAAPAAQTGRRARAASDNNSKE